MDEVQVEHDDWRFREKKVISPNPSQEFQWTKGKHNWPRYQNPPTHMQTSFWFGLLQLNGQTLLH
jgi:hypothetical protein